MSKDDSDLPIDDKALEGLYQIAQDANALYATVQNAYNESQKDYLKGHLEYSYRVIQTVGILAGFGFTAISRVQTVGLFIFGELLLMLAIIFGLYKTRNVYTSTIDSLESEGNKKKKVAWERSKYCSEVFRKASKDSKIPADFKERLAELDESLIGEFSGNLHEEKSKFKDHLIPMIATGFLGIVFILLSFLKLSLGC